MVDFGTSAHRKQGLMGNKIVDIYRGIHSLLRMAIANLSIYIEMTIKWWKKHVFSIDTCSCCVIFLDNGLCNDYHVWVWPWWTLSRPQPMVQHGAGGCCPSFSLTLPIRLRSCPCPPSKTAWDTFALSLSTSLRARSQSTVVLWPQLSIKYHTQSEISESAHNKLRLGMKRLNLIILFYFFFKWHLANNKIFFFLIIKQQSLGVFCLLFVYKYTFYWLYHAGTARLTNDASFFWFIKKKKSSGHFSPSFAENRHLAWLFPWIITDTNCVLFVQMELNTTI